jgi:heparin/heparan-sulfate lyase
MKRFVILVPLFSLLAGIAVCSSPREDSGSYPEWLGDLKPVDGEFKVRPDRPRLYVTSEDIPLLKSRISGSHSDAWREIRADRGSNRLPDRILANAFCYLIEKDAQIGRAAVEAALALSADTSRGDLPNAYRVWPEAIAYDWCHDAWRPDERKLFIENVRKQLHKAGGRTLESHPLHMGHLVNHLADAHLPAGIAFYEDAPDIYQRALAVALPEIAAKNVFYRYGASSQGNSYGVTHYNGDIRMLMMLEKATGEELFDRFPFYRDVGYYWIYTRRPDGQLLRNGDDYLDSGRSGSYWGPAWLTEALVYAVSAYGDPYLLGEYMKMRSLDNTWTAINDILHRDPRLDPKDPESLPEMKWLDGAAGTLLFRTGWGDDDVVGSFKVMPLYVKNHDHLDRLSFQIYCRGALALDSGLYEGVDSGYGTPHWTNYFQRTIAHNTLLIRDPNETVLLYGKPVQADGGQRFPGDGGNPGSLEDLKNPIWHVARVLNHEMDSENGLHAFVTADATAGYGPKAEMVRRSFVLLKGFGGNRSAGKPAAVFIVYDRVVSSSPEFEKVWLLHTMEEPDVDGGSFSVTRTGEKYGGCLVSATLLPESAELKKVGGPGAEFLVGDINYATRKGGDAEAGAWRIEVSSGAEPQSVDFLHALAVYPERPAAAPEMRRIAGEGIVGVELLDRTVVMVPHGETARELEYESRGTGERNHLVLGLPSGKKARIVIDGGGLIKKKISRSGSLAFRTEREGNIRVRITVE